MVLCFEASDYKNPLRLHFINLLLTVPKVTTVDAPSLGLGQDLLSESPTMTELMSLIEQMGLSHLFVSDAFYPILVSLQRRVLSTR
jgi:hypothetical protein